jgi:hypothetical protein
MIAQLHLENVNVVCHFSTGLCLRKSAVTGKRTVLVIGYVQKDPSSETTLDVDVITKDIRSASVRI